MAIGLGKIFGFKIVKWVVGEANATKYAQIIEKKGKFFLIFAFLSAAAASFAASDRY